MMSSYFIVALALLGKASSLQVPLFGALSHSQTPLVEKDVVSSESLQDRINADNLLRHAESLSKIADLAEEENGNPTRVIGSEGHLGTIDYIYSTLAELGDYYVVSNQTFTAVIGHVYEYSLVFDDDIIGDAVAMSLTPPTPNRRAVFGDLALVSNLGCDASDYTGLENRIALISRGQCPFGTKSALAGRAGALAAIIYNNEKGAFGGTLGTPSPDHIATFSISDDVAENYIQKLKNGESVAAVAYIVSTVDNIETTNIIAETKAGDTNNCVMLGGHSDSVAEGPGINDDGTGSLSLLEIAIQLTNYEVNNCVRFAWWAGEEEGLLGSDYYVSVLSPEENMKIRLFMDYDMLASPNFAFQVYNATNAVNPLGSEELRDLYTEFYTSHGLNFTYIPFDGRSDYDAFIKNGIPGGGIATGAEGVKTEEERELFGGVAGEWYDPCYHQICDTVENLNLTAWELNTKLVAHSVATYAQSFKSFPKRTGITTTTEIPLSKYHGSKLQL